MVTIYLSVAFVLPAKATIQKQRPSFYFFRFFLRKTVVQPLSGVDGLVLPGFELLTVLDGPDDELQPGIKVTVD